MKRWGLLTEKQMKVLQLRRKGLSYREIAKLFKTTEENIYILERRALTNIQKARKTIEALKLMDMAVELKIPRGVKLSNVPAKIYRVADKHKIKLNFNYVELLQEIADKAGDKLGNKMILKDITVYIFWDGSITVE
ncbi:MAG TPA: Tfx family DNA-binding protein [Nitrososphaeria archaeon]|nr:Tfx family DNA-binding protein [Nitrososphaeria archaeon]